MMQILRASLVIWLLTSLLSCEQQQRQDLKYLEIGKEYFVLQQYDSAFLAFQESAKKNPNNDVAIAYKAYCYYYFGNYKPALLNFDKALSINKSNNIALFGKSLTLMNLGDYTHAFILLDSVGKTNPKHDKCFYYKAITRMNFYDTTNAITDLEKAIYNAPEYQEPYYLLSSIYLQLKQINTADSLARIASQKSERIRNY